MMTKDEFKKAFLDELDTHFSVAIDEATDYELFEALSAVVRHGYSENWRRTRTEDNNQQTKQVYYFSIEFLPGTLLRSNLLNLGWLDQARDALKDLDLDLDQVALAEPDLALGNGGLGRLASCFMDSLASEGYAANGNGIYYKYGLFTQKFVDGYQVEMPNDWTKSDSPWLVRRKGKSALVHFGGNYTMTDQDGWLTPVYEGDKVVLAVPYDIAVVGYHNHVTNTMRLWNAEIPSEDEIDYRTIQDRRTIEDLTSVLYPNDSTYDGRLLRLKQEYFFVSTGIQSILRYFVKNNGTDAWDKLPDEVAIHINDTHPAMCVAELMRLLVDDYRVDWDRAWQITQQVMSYTNHTIMAEALEKWDVNMFRQLLPRLMDIITEIDRRYVEGLQGRVDGQVIDRTRIISGNQVHMAHLAIIGSHSINGVAELHTQLLKTTVLNDFYNLYPDRFNNKTNGITLRRWLQLANPQLSQLLDDQLGSTWRKDSRELLKLEQAADDPKVLQQLGKIKLANKQKLANLIKQQTGLVVDPTAIFDVQVKRLHAYKRQTLKLLHVLALYRDLKNGIDHPKRVVIFGAKAAPSYVYAKQVIKVINEVAKLVNNDPDVKDRLKVVFLENYGVTLAEQIIPAADLSEQISTTTKEASGTSNMKLMANGALTVATMDGANIEIAEAVGDDNIFIFGLNKDQVNQAYADHSYDPKQLYDQSPVVKEIVELLIDGTIPNCQAEAKALYDSFVQYNEPFFVLADLESYLQAQARVEEAWQGQAAWAKRSLVNIAHAERFDADHTVQLYAQDIWHLTPLSQD